MAKNKMKPKSAPKRSRRRARRSADPAITNGVAKYAALLQDPCNSNIDLEERYRGEQGFVQRFVSDGTINTTAGHTAGFVLFHPNSDTVVSFSAPASNTTLAISLPTYALAGGIPGPGQSYLTSAADKIRAYAACIQAYPSAVSITNLTGEYAVGVISMSATFGTWSTDSFFTMLSGRGAMTKSRTECKWYPGSLDDRYSGFNANLTIDPTDTNVIVLAYRGYPAAAALSIRLTTVLEWTPRVALGISPTQTTSKPLPHDHVVATLHAHKPTWLHNLGEAFGSAASTFLGGVAHDAAKVGRYLAQRGMAAGVSRLESAVLGGAMALL